MKDAQYYIDAFDMQAHPEGGYYKRTLASTDETTTKSGVRSLYSSIYFLLRSGEVSHFHRLKSDEIWFYHTGSPLTLHIISPDGVYSEIQLGLEAAKGESPQVMVPKHSIFGCSVNDPNTFGLVSCVVSPGFVFEDFEMFSQAQLLALYPQYEDMIRKLA